MKKEEVILNSLRPDQRREIMAHVEQTYDTNIAKDPVEVTKHIRSLENKLERALASETYSKGYPLLNSSTSILGYEPAGSVLRKLYPNPFSVYSFIGNNHWATLLARMAVREEVARDGYVLVASPGTSKKR